MYTPRYYLGSTFSQAHCNSQAYCSSPYRVWTHAQCAEGAPAHGGGWGKTALRRVNHAVARCDLSSVAGGPSYRVCTHAQCGGGTPAQGMTPLLLQEVLLRRCIAALHTWRRIAAAQQRRTNLLLGHAGHARQHRLAASTFEAWRQVVEGAKAEAAFIFHSLSAEDKALLLATVTAWRRGAARLKRLQALR